MASGIVSTASGIGAVLGLAVLRALVTGDAVQFGEPLAADAILYSDGGGKRAAALNPIHGRDRIVRFFEGLAQAGNLPPPEAVRRVRLHGLPGLVVIDRGGAMTRSRRSISATGASWRSTPCATRTSSRISRSAHSGAEAKIRRSGIEHQVPF